jgi:AcrR family transcriptional regulator
MTARPIDTDVAVPPPPPSPSTQHRGTRRAGRRKTQVLEAAVKVLAERGAEGTRFTDVSQASGVPISTLQYYFGSLEDLVVAAFRYASEHETVGLADAMADLADPWDRLVRIVDTVLDGCRPENPESDRLWIESWRYGMRDPEMREIVLGDYATWRGLIAEAVRAGLASGRFTSGCSPEPTAIIVLSLLDGMGLPLAMGDPAVPFATGRGLILEALDRLLLPVPPIEV